MTPVLLEKVKEDLRALRLKDMAEALDAALENAHDKSHLQVISQLVEIQLAAVKSRSVKRRIQKAGLPQNMTFDNFDWNFQPDLNTEQLRNLKDLSFVLNRQPLIIIAKTGAGKSHIAAALGIKACQAGFKVQLESFQGLLAKLYATLADDSTDEMISRLARLDLLIIDHVNHIRTKPEYPSLLLDLVSTCHEKLSFIITTSISFEEWAEALGNASITHAIIDRLMHRAHVINIRNALSYRTQGPHAPQVNLQENNLS
ncbi:MAG: IS21-like element helper ATPase IstB [Thermodesulfobacteriota bacterium]